MDNKLLMSELEDFLDRYELARDKKIIVDNNDELEELAEYGDALLAKAREAAFSAANFAYATV